MADPNILTAPTSHLLDADEHPPPRGTTLLVLSKYGVLTKGQFTYGFHVAWAPLPKVPNSVKEKLNR